MRRLKAFECIDALRRTLAPMLAGHIDALLLPPAELCACMESVALAVGDLAAQVLRPLPAPPVYAVDPQNKPSVMAPTGGVASLQPPQQQADVCVLQLMLAARLLELLAALVLHVNVHVCRQARLHEQTRNQQQQQEAGTQLQQLCQQHAQLLASIRALVLSLASSQAGWSFLRAAREDLAQLAAAVCPTHKVTAAQHDVNLSVTWVARHSNHCGGVSTVLAPWLCRAVLPAATCVNTPLPGVSGWGAV
jgi:hypothetical protein